jgi:hypothetical protein
MKLLPIIALLTSAPTALALAGNPNVGFTPAKGSFPLVAKGQPARVVIDTQDWPGVARAGKDLQGDLARVAQFKGELGPNSPLILVGTLGRSPQIDALVKAGKIDVSAIRGKWEASVTQVVGNTLVVAGADKRGTIYALYDLSESSGVSPWNWWADVPVKRHANVFVKGRTVAKSPVVKYRGIFLNDEAPALSNWVYANFGNYNHKFYEKVFELLLRLRANYLWPAMWNNCFSQDDPENPRLADEYGIVMGTSHVEPMMRADKEWNRLGFGEKQWNYASNPADLEKFWTDGVIRNKPYENIVTMAMRGKIDTPMSETANISLLEQIVAAQRKILAENVNPNLSEIPQLWCLYKEVQEYYEKGMRVPDDVTLLWADDNWGNIRRLPTAEERNRKGGAGVYYHFDYVGGPRNYKWIDTNPIPKIWEQMNLAHQYGADRIWIVNVGDLKPMEFPLEFFLTMARDPDAMKKEELQKYTERWAAREFGAENAKAVADIVAQTKRLNGRRKPELVSSETYNVENYGEVDRVVGEFKSLLSKAEAVGKRLPVEAQSAYYQLVIHPVKAPGLVTEMYVAAAKNARFAKLGDPRANVEAQRVRDLFAQDQAVTAEYHAVNAGKWNHFMDQTHIGYTYWQQPDTNVMPKVVQIEVPEEASMGVAVADAVGPFISTDDRLIARAPRITFHQFGRATYDLDIYNRGRTPFPFSIQSSSPWISLSRTSGVVDRDVTVKVSIDWAKAPKATSEATLEISGAGQKQLVSIFCLEIPHARGYAEGDGYVSIEAEHTSRRISVNGVNWGTIPGYGRTLSGVEPFPVLAPSAAPGKGARIEYDLTTFTGGKVTLETIVGPSLGFQPGRGLRLAIAFDDEKPQVVDVAPKYLSREWETAVSDSVQKVQTQHTLKPGKHVLKVWAIDAGVVIERFVLDLGGLKPSYLGPPESRRLP